MSNNTETRKSGTSSGRDSKGRFAAGNPGKPKGARHKTTRAAEKLLHGEAEALTRTAIDMALAGDSSALRLCLERILPAYKAQSAPTPVPAMQQAVGLADKALAALEAAGAGDIGADAAAQLVAAVASVARVVEIDELVKRVEALEGKQ